MTDHSAPLPTRVWKIPFPPGGGSLQVHADSVLHVNLDAQKNLALWFFAGKKPTQVIIRTTGEELPGGDWTYMNTFFRNGIEFHAFAREMS